MQKKTTKEELRSLIIKDKTSLAIEQLVSLDTFLKDQDLYDEAINLASDFQNFEKEFYGNRLSFEEQRIWKNKINSRLLFIINQLPDNKSLEKTTINTNFKKSFIPSLLIVASFIFFYWILQNKSNNVPITTNEITNDIDPPTNKEPSTETEKIDNDESDKQEEETIEVKPTNLNKPPPEEIPNDSGKQEVFIKDSFNLHIESEYLPQAKTVQLKYGNNLVGEYELSKRGTFTIKADNIKKHFDGIEKTKVQFKLLKEDRSVLREGFDLLDFKNLENSIIKIN